MRFPALMRRQIKRCMKGMGVLSGLLHIAPTHPIILCYHSVRARPDEVEDSIGGAITHSAAAFEEQMELISRRFVPVTLDDILQSIEGRSRLPHRAVAVTFDDGYHDNYVVAAPILARHGIRAAFYVSTGPIRDGSELWFVRLRRAFASTASLHWPEPGTDRVHSLADPMGRAEAYRAAARQCAVLAGDSQYAMLESIEAALAVSGRLGERLMLSWEQVAALDRAGHIVGAHTRYHANLAHISGDCARAEIAGSKADLENVLGKPVVHFAYPTPFLIEPHFSQETVAITEELGFRTAVTWLRGAVRKSSRALTLPRIAAPLECREFAWVLQANMLGYAT